jgi:uncharacterized protein YjbI with pentapeptide repeats
MITVVDLMSQNPEGISISKIESLIIEDNKKNVLQNLIDAGILKQDGTKVLSGSNLDKALMCLEILRNLLAVIKKENEVKVYRKVSINLNESDLAGADLHNVDLRNANLAGVDLSYATLTGADLSDVNLNGVDLSRTNLSKANLSRARLTGADLSYANSRLANTKSTILEHV